MCNHWLHIDKEKDMGFQLALWVCGPTGLLTTPRPSYLSDALSVPTRFRSLGRQKSR